MSVELLTLAERERAKRKARAEQKKKLETFHQSLTNQHTNDPVQKCSAGDKECCKKIWKKVEKEAKTISNQKDVVVRNKQINAAYADLYLTDPKNPKVHIWAGTASLVSKQVGCTMVNNVAANNETLGVGNVAIFDNIYPTMKMHQLSQKAKPPMTEAQLLACLKKTVGEKKSKHFTRAIKKMFAGKGYEAAKSIATHEQKVIVQNAMWNSSMMKVQATGNMLILGAAADQSVYFVADCSKPKEAKLSFPTYRNISSADTRVEYYIDLFLPRFKTSEDKSKMKTIMEGIRLMGGTH